MYSNAVLNVFKNPKNCGRISKPDGIADCYNEDNTAHVEFSLRIEGGIITNCQFRAQANPYIIAVCSTITGLVKGKMVSMLFLDPFTIKKELGDESPIDIMFCIDCVKMAVVDYKEKLEKQDKQKKEDAVEVQNEPENNNQEIKEEVAVQPKVENDNSDEDDDFDFSDFFDDDLL